MHLTGTYTPIPLLSLSRNINLIPKLEFVSIDQDERCSAARHGVTLHGFGPKAGSALQVHLILCAPAQTCANQRDLGGVHRKQHAPRSGDPYCPARRHSSHEPTSTASPLPTPRPHPSRCPCARLEEALPIELFARCLIHPLLDQSLVCTQVRHVCLDHLLKLGRWVAGVWEYTRRAYRYQCRHRKRALCVSCIPDSTW